MQESNRVLKGDDLLGRIVGDFATEFLFECHHEFDRVQTIGTKIVDKAGRICDFFFVNAKVFNDDFLYTVGDVTNSHIPLDLRRDRASAVDGFPTIYGHYSAQNVAVRRYCEGFVTYFRLDD